MPYLITTKTPTEPDAYSRFKEAQADGRIGPASRRAVATLDEAREAVLIGGEPLAAEFAERYITEQGGTVALPDGTLIEVERITWRRLNGGRAPLPIEAAQRRILAAYNAAQEGGE